MPNSAIMGGNGASHAVFSPQVGPPGSAPHQLDSFGSFPPTNNVPGRFAAPREGVPPGHGGLAASSASRFNATKTLLIVDNVRLTRECLSHLLMTRLVDFEIISIADPQQLSQYSVWPDVVLLNSRGAHGKDGALLNEIGAIYAGSHRAPVLVLSENIEADANEATEAGMASLFPSSWGVELLVAAISLVVAGGQFRAPAIATNKSGHARKDSNGAR